MTNFSAKSADEALFINGRIAHMAVEVAVRTFRQAERPMNIDREASLVARSRRGEAGSAIRDCVHGALYASSARLALGAWLRRPKPSFEDIRFVETTFEAWSTERAAFRLVAAAQAWHRVAPNQRFKKVFEALPPDGALAVFGSAPMDVPPPLGSALEKIHATYAPQLAGPPPERAYLPNGPFAREFEQSSLFGPMLHKCYSWLRRYTAESYVEYLASLSRYQMLDATVRATLLNAIATTGQRPWRKFRSPL
jgi:hypothetical protein